jgi:hypothetical protein
VDHLKGRSIVYMGSPHRPSIDLKYHGKVGEHESIHSNKVQLIGQSMMIPRDGALRAFASRMANPPLRV